MLGLLPGDAMSGSLRLKWPKTDFLHLWQHFVDVLHRFSVQPWSTAVIALINVAKSDITMCSSFWALAEADDDDGQAQLFDVD